MCLSLFKYLVKSDLALIKIEVESVPITHDSTSGFQEIYELIPLVFISLIISTLSPFSRVFLTGSNK